MQKYKLRYREFGKTHIVVFEARHVYDARDKALKMLKNSSSVSAWIITPSRNYVSLTN